MLERIPFITQEEDKTFYWFENGYLLFNEKKRHFCQVIEALPIKNIVFSGGGTRGVLYAGVINAFEEFTPSACQGGQHFLSQIETISGASIGSVFAATMAAGIRSNELLDSIGSVNFAELLGTGLGPIKRSADPLYILLKEIIANTIRNRLSELDGEKQEDLLEIHHELEKESTLSVINFGMLKTLHNFYPHIFKELYIVSVCKENGTVCYFSEENTPQLEIALACRASVAVPVIVEPVKIPKAKIKLYANDVNLPEMISFVDGGLLDNVPFSIMENKQKKTHGLNKGAFNQNLQTLIIFFDDSIAAEYNFIEGEKKKLHYSQSPFLNARRFSKHELAPKTKFDFIYDMAPKMIGGINMNNNYSKQREKLYEQIRQVYSQRNIPLPAAFTSSDFISANIYGPLAIKKSKQLTLDYLDNHQNECIYQTYQHVNQLIKHLPHEWVMDLIKHIHQIPWLNHLTPEIIEQIRDNNHSISILQGHFGCYFQEIYSYKNIAKTLFYKELMNHFLLIRKDVHANDAAKMIRALGITLDYYPRLMKAKESDKILFLLNHKFKKYFHSKKNEKLDLTIEHFCMDKNARSYFNKTHVFYVKFQRIIFLLKKTRSSFINPEDPFKRRFLKTIVHELHDIAAFYLTEKEKLKKMENYLFESYYKIIFYQKKPESMLACTLKNIIESKAGLNLPYQYGIHLPTIVDQLPNFNGLLKENYKIKKLIFIKKFFQLEFKYQTLSIPFEFNAIKKIFFPLMINIENITLMDEIKMQAIVTAFLFAPDDQNRQYAANLKYFIIPSDINNNKNLYKTIFETISLMGHLVWTKPLSNEKELYEEIMIELKCLVLDYVSEQQSRVKLSTLLKKYSEELIKIEAPALFGFFKPTSEVLELIQSFRRQALFEVNVQVCTL